MAEMDTTFRLDKHLVRRSFDRAAPHYDDVAVLQREVGSRLLERLDLIRLHPTLICDVGCGTGVAARELMRRYRRARMIALDPAPGMLRIASRRAPILRKIWAVCADGDSLPLADASCDLLFSNLSLEWCQDLDRTFSELFRVLRPGGLLMFSMFGPDTLRELRVSWRQADGYSHVNAFFDMHDVGDAMVRAGLGDPVLDVEHFTLTYSDVAGLMRDLKSLGTVNATAGRPMGLTGKGRMRAVNEAYEGFRIDGVLPATYEVVYGHAWRVEGQPRAQRADGSTVVPVSAIRRTGQRS